MFCGILCNFRCIKANFSKVEWFEVLLDWLRTRVDLITIEVYPSVGGTIVTFQCEFRLKSGNYFPHLLLVFLKFKRYHPQHIIYIVV